MKRFWLVVGCVGTFMAITILTALAAPREIGVAIDKVVQLVFAIAALIVMVGRVPVGQALTVGLPEAFQIPTWANWLLEWPQNAAKRGIAIGAGLGLMATGLRIILGIERSYMREES